MNNWLLKRRMNPEHHSGHYGVYAVWPELNRFVKIGMSSNVPRRIGEFQPAHGEDLHLICWFKCESFYEARMTEYRLHSSLQLHRGNGEHFKIGTKDSEVFEFLETFGGVQGMVSRDAMRFADTLRHRPGQPSYEAGKSLDDLAKEQRRIFSESISPKLKDRFCHQQEQINHLHRRDNY